MQPFLFLDLETTGHEPIRMTGAIESIAPFTKRPLLEPYHEIIDIGAVFVDPKDLSVIDTFEQKIAPQHPGRHEDYAERVNGFVRRSTAGEWDSAFCLEKAIRALLDRCLGPVHLVGQNFFFDWTFLLVAFATCGITEEEIDKAFHYKKIDTASMSVQALLTPDEVYDPKNFSLRSGRLQEALGIEPEPLPHTALNGAYQAHKTFCALRQLSRKDRPSIVL